MSMLEYLIAILGLGALCAGWVIFQRWLGKLDPDPDEDAPKSKCGGCSGCNPDKG